MHVIINFRILISNTGKPCIKQGNNNLKRLSRVSQLELKSTMVLLIYLLILLSAMSGYKPFLVPTVLGTERRNSRFLFAPRSQVQQSSCSHGAGRSGIFRAANNGFIWKNLYLALNTDSKEVQIGLTHLKDTKEI